MSMRTKQLTHEHIDLARQIVEREKRSRKNDSEIRGMQLKEKQLADEIEVFR